MIEAVIFNALRGLVPNDRVFPESFEQPDGTMPPWPSICYSLTDSEPVISICGTGASDTDDSQIEFEVAAKSHGAMIALRANTHGSVIAIWPRPRPRKVTNHEMTANRRFRPPTR